MRLSVWECVNRGKGHRMRAWCALATQKRERCRSWGTAKPETNEFSKRNKVREQRVMRDRSVCVSVYRMCSRGSMCFTFVPKHQQTSDMRDELHETGETQTETCNGLSVGNQPVDLIVVCCSSHVH